MRQTLFFFALSLIGTISAGQEIAWSMERLTWKDFTKRTGPVEFYKAFTQSAISFSLDEADDRVVIVLQASFDPKESWVHRDHQKEALLAHEQLHFDITEWYTREMRKEMAVYHGMNSREFAEKELNDEVKKIYKERYNEMTKIQQKYDLETRHGTDAEQQELWRKKVSQALADLGAFSR